MVKLLGTFACSFRAFGFFSVFTILYFFLNKGRLKRSPCCLCVCVALPLEFARQPLGKNVLVATNTHARIDELLDTMFSDVLVSNTQ
jgi:hypothetical protein